MGGPIYSTGDLDDGYYKSADWSGPGRDLRLFYTFSCECGRYGVPHETIEEAEAEARAHTSAASRGDIANPS